MLKFGLITEGVTDQKVIENIVEGVFGDEAEINPLQPIGDETYNASIESIGGWERVFKYCSSTEFEPVLLYNDYLIVQIDTDRCEDKNYDIPRRNMAGEELTPEEMISQVREKLIRLIGEEVWSTFDSRIIFAIAVDSIECWILVLYARAGSETKYLHCEVPLERALQRRNIPVTPSNKNPREYEKISGEFSKRKDLLKAIRHNDGLRIFVEQLQQIES